MSLSKDTLKNDLMSVFTAMSGMSSGGNEYFASQVSAKIASYIKTGSISTTDAGTISAGVFTGSGTGSLDADASLCEPILIAACNAMNSMPSGGNDYLATELAKGIHKMATESNAVETNVSGTAIQGSTQTSVSGTAKGSFSGTQSSLQSAFSAAFAAMMNMTSGGDAYMADEIAKAVTSYLTGGSVSTQGEGALSGSTGTGTIS